MKIMYSSNKGSLKELTMRISIKLLKAIGTPTITRTLIKKCIALWEEQLYTTRFWISRI